MSETLSIPQGNGNTGTAGLSTTDPDSRQNEVKYVKGRRQFLWENAGGQVWLKDLSRTWQGRMQAAGRREKASRTIWKGKPGRYKITGVLAHSPHLDHSAQELPPHPSTSLFTCSLTDP